jgi:hypothetical protein
MVRLVAMHQYMTQLLQTSQRKSQIYYCQHTEMRQDYSMLKGKLIRAGLKYAKRLADQTWI